MYRASAIGEVEYVIVLGKISNPIWSKHSIPFSAPAYGVKPAFGRLCNIGIQWVGGIFIYDADTSSVHINLEDLAVFINRTEVDGGDTP